MTDYTTAQSSYNPTAAKILSTAAHLFMQLGYRAVSINDIVKAAEVTKPTLYYYFRDKEELFVQMALQRLLDTHATLEAAVAGQPTIDAQLAGLAAALLNANDGDMRMLRHEMHEHLSPAGQARLGAAFHQHLFAPVQQVMQQGLDRGDMAGHSAAELTMLFLGLMEAFHGITGQLDNIGMPRESGQLRPAVFAPAAVVGLFLHGVSGFEKVGDLR